MKLKTKNETPHHGWTFWFMAPNGQKVRVVGPTFEELCSRTRGHFRNFKMEIPDNLNEIIEHQICLRQPHPTKDCWSGGLGDDLHHLYIAPALGKTARKLEAVGESIAAGKDHGIRAGIRKLARAAAKVVRRVASCGGCSGTRTFVSGKNNLGRAGTVNRLTKRKKKKQ